MPAWKTIKYLRQGQTDQYDYLLTLPVPLADWDVFDYWERERVESMRSHLTKDDILYDIGAEHGWLSVVYSSMVGGENMVLFEPTPEFWPNIKQTWEKNVKFQPSGFFPGFASDQNSFDFSESNLFSWPKASLGELIDKNSYKNLSDESHVLAVPQITIDNYAELTGIIPSALTIDVEGAELTVLRGAEKLLRENNLKVWVSEHDDLAFKQYAVFPNWVKDFMEFLGYKREVLATDHERHVYYSK